MINSQRLLLKITGNEQRTNEINVRLIDQLFAIQHPYKRDPSTAITPIGLDPQILFIHNHYYRVNNILLIHRLQVFLIYYMNGIMHKIGVTLQNHYDIVIHFMQWFLFVIQVSNEQNYCLMVSDYRPWTPMGGGRQVGRQVGMVSQIMILCYS